MVEPRVLRDLVSENLSTREIARRLGYGHSSIIYWMKKLGIQPRLGPGGTGRRKRTEQEIAARVVKKVTVHRKRLKARAVAYKGGRCALCGYNKCNGALEFHHLDRRTKAFGFSKKGWTRSWNVIRKELDKCVLVCANC